MMDEYLIANTTRAQREQIVAEALGNIDASCDGCSSGVLKMYEPYIEGTLELRECTMSFQARYVKDMEREDRSGCGVVN